MWYKIEIGYLFFRNPLNAVDLKKINCKNKTFQHPTG